MDRDEAERLASELNEDYPDFIHEAISTESALEPALEAVAA